VVKLGLTDIGPRDSLKARALLVVILVILSLMKNFLDLNSLMLNKYQVIQYFYLTFDLPLIPFKCTPRMFIFNRFSKNTSFLLSSL
jgi:hypothetical protein